MRKVVSALAFATALGAGWARAQDLAAFEKRVHLTALPNGLTVVVCARPEAPVFSFFTLVDVGADREVPGIRGLAHMFEHMAFKGTETIGTTDATAERSALERVETTYAAYDAQRRKPADRDPDKLANLEREWRKAMAEADAYVVSDAFSALVEREGGVNLNAFTSNEETGYFYSLPANRLELWAALESDRFLKPVLREFYKERDVVMEERRMHESDPTDRLFEQFLATAFVAHPYGQPVLGWPSELESFSATDARSFYERYYVPANMIVVVVGDVDPGEVFSLAERYLGRLPRGAKPGPLRVVEPPQAAERQVVLREQAQPYFVEGYHRPAVTDPDDAVFDVISDILSNGRTSRLYRSLVRDKKIATQAGGFSGFPGDKYPNLFVLTAVTTPGHTPAEARDAIHVELERLKDEDVSADDLRMARVRAKASLIRRLGNNLGLAMELAFAQARFGDWRELFRQVERIERVSAADVKRVANATFAPLNRTVGIIESTQPAGGAQ